MRKFHALFAFVVLLAALLVNCAPQVTRAPSTSPLSPPAPVSVAAPNLPTTTAQDDNWAKVVEAAKKEGKLTFYSYLFTGDLGLAASRAFFEKYGIEVEHITGRGAELSARLKTEQRMGQIVGDIFQAASANVEIAKQLGLTRSATDLPVFKEQGVWSIDPFALDKEGHVVILTATQYTPFVNKNLVKVQDEPMSWQDFLNPKWRGKIIIQDPQIATLDYYVMLALMDNGAIDQEFIKKIGGQLFMAPSPQEALKALARGEAHISLWSSDTDASAMVAEGAPIKPIAPQDSIVVGGTPLALIKGAPHPNAAQVFVNWLFSGEGLSLYARISRTAAIRKDVLDFRPEVMKIKPSKIFIITSEENQRAAELFQQRTLVDLWKK